MRRTSAEFSDEIGGQTVYVPYLDPEVFEKEAESFTDSYHKCRPFSGLPVPIEDMLENFCRIRLGFDDLRQLYGVEGILAEFRVEDREVIVDQSLEPDLHPWMRGRYVFTLAHELGHWQLHRHFLDDRRGPLLVHRDGGVKTPLEFQADYFAGRLLMPRDAMLQAWAEIAKGCGPIISSHLLNDVASWFATILRAMAQRFGVSKTAMRIRLAQLGLLVQDIAADCAAESSNEFKVRLLRSLMAVKGF